MLGCSVGAVRRFGRASCLRPCFGAAGRLDATLELFRVAGCSGLAATRHASGIRGTGLDGLGTGGHLVAFHDGIRVIRHAGDGQGLVIESARGDRLDHGRRLDCRDAGGNLDLIPRIAR